MSIWSLHLFALQALATTFSRSSASSSRIGVAPPKEPKILFSEVHERSERDLSLFEAANSLAFQDKDLLRLAFRHPSAREKGADQGRLEFIGPVHSA